MKRNFLLTLAAAATVALLGSAQAALACPVGTTNGGLLAGNYAIKIAGAVTLTNAGLGGDPSPLPEGGIGVIHLDGSCNITGGDFIYNKNDTQAGWSSPASIDLNGPPNVPIFGGAITGADFGSAVFNSNNTGIMTLVEGTSGIVFTFSVTSEAGGAEFRGARLTAGDPVVIIGEKQAALTPTYFLVNSAVSFDAGSGGQAGGGTGVGFDAVQVEALTHLDPETNTTPEGGGSITFNVDNGYDSTFAPGIQFIPPGGGALICDYHEAFIQAPSATDGTYATDAALDGDYGCPLSPSHFENAVVVWGTTNQNGFLLTTGDSGNAALGPSTGSAGKAISPGAIHVVAPVVVMVAVGNSSPWATNTVTVTNDSAEPLDYTGITLSAGLTNVSIDASSTCLTGGGDLAAWNMAIGLPQTCTIVLKDTGSKCALAGPQFQTGFLTIAGTDHAAVPASLNTAAGIAVPVTCK